jgi:hypothetical protein
MAKLPGWMRSELDREKGVFIIHIRWWHPYVWYLWIKGIVKRKLGV